MRMLVCGSREWADESAVFCRIRDYMPAIVIEGGARGADAMAQRSAIRLGIPVETVPADWSKNGPRAGMIRNREMLKYGKPDIVLAFWDGKSRGTKHMIEIAEAAGVPVEIIRP